VRVVHNELKRLDIPWQWDAGLHCYVIPRTRCDDLAAALEDIGHFVDMRMPTW
jgi:hypothetical protein